MLTGIHSRIIQDQKLHSYAGIVGGATSEIGCYTSLPKNSKILYRCYVFQLRKDHLYGDQSMKLEYVNVIGLFSAQILRNIRS